MSEVWGKDLNYNLKEWSLGAWGNHVIANPFGTGQYEWQAPPPMEPVARWKAGVIALMAKALGVGADVYSIKPAKVQRHQQGDE